MRLEQEQVEERYIEKEYTSDLLTLGLGLCEEVGELAKTINQQNPKYKPTEGREEHSIGHELCDVLVYLFAIANVLDIDLEVLFEYFMKGEV